MSLKAYIWSLMLSTLLAMGAWIFVLLKIDPYESGIVGQGLFYFIFWLMMLGIFVNVLVWLRVRFLGGEQGLSTMGLSFRQGFLLSLLIVALLVLRASGYLVWWLGLLVVAGFFLIELIFLSKEE